MRRTELLDRLQLLPQPVICRASVLAAGAGFCCDASGDLVAHCFIGRIVAGRQHFVLQSPKMLDLLDGIDQAAKLFDGQFLVGPFLASVDCVGQQFDAFLIVGIDQFAINTTGFDLRHIGGTLGRRQQRLGNQR